MMAILLLVFERRVISQMRSTYNVFSFLNQRSRILLHFLATLAFLSA